MVQHVLSQEISFFHLNKSQGLSDNLVIGAVRDHSGLLWITTTEGLNCYDGYSVKKFYKEDYPELYSNDLRNIICDSKNRLWIRHGEGRVTVVDQNRKFHPAIIDTGQPTCANSSCVPASSKRSCSLKWKQVLY